MDTSPSTIYGHHLPSTPKCMDTIPLQNSGLWTFLVYGHFPHPPNIMAYGHFPPIPPKIGLWTLPPTPPPKVVVPVVSRIHYKVATLCYNSFTESYPVYLSELLTVYHPSRQLRSISDTRTFRIPFTKTKTFGQRAFSFMGPTEWNSLPYDVRHSVSTSSFKQALKTHLFISAYN